MVINNYKKHENIDIDPNEVRYFVYNRYEEQYLNDEKYLNNVLERKGVSNSNELVVVTVNKTDDLTDEDIYARYPDAREISYEEYQEVTSAIYNLQLTSVVNTILARVAYYTDVYLSYILDPSFGVNRIDTTYRSDVKSRQEVKLLLKLTDEVEAYRSNPSDTVKYRNLSVYADLINKNIEDTIKDIEDFRHDIDTKLYTILAIKRRVVDIIQQAYENKDKLLLDKYYKDVKHVDMQHVYDDKETKNPEDLPRILITPEWLDFSSVVSFIRNSYVY